MIPSLAWFVSALPLLSWMCTALPEHHFVEKSSIRRLPRGWFYHGTPSPRTPITLHFGLTQPHFHQIESALLEISDPSSPRWMQHLTKEEVEEFSAPHTDSVILLESFLVSHGIDITGDALQRTPANDWISLKTTIGIAEKFLNTTYSIYVNHETGLTAIRTTSYSLPAHLHDHIDVVQPTDYFPSGRPLLSSLIVDDGSLNQRSASASAPLPQLNMSLPQLKQLYHTDAYKAKGTRSSIGIAGYLEQYANLADLKQFYSLFYPPAVNSTPHVELINGAINSQNISEAGVEANLDVQFTGGISYPLKQIFYSTYGRGENTNKSVSYQDNGNEPYHIFLPYLLGKKTEDLPLVLTSSYGEDEDTVPIDYARRVCKLYAALGSRGVSALHSSGDGGVDGVGHAGGSGACSTPNRFVPVFPAGCPHVTTVGATYQIPETAWTSSGGGFSNYFPSPQYQHRAVSSYLETLGSVYEGLFNKSGRAYPDCASQGYRCSIVYQGEVKHASGTSVSSPTFAAIIALLNDALLSKGRGPLGFLNPWIYSLEPGVLNDITTGSNPGCGTTGFNATKGWDPVTGFGTPDLPRLLKALQL
ncbi:tripeptidyl peptidase A [Cantharellus anzutake]|uniref:tripeptidyl peptidase A n=1 Tax=Cantharellus anzutake TaxID=1750568 RepID=UPI001902CC69|nr:tripeptidyl peptidase A [Cantharellus anzutake]KAF8334118.1 tripeptidyl peptidase A [Cantharellus anzutake]